MSWVLGPDLKEQRRPQPGARHPDSAPLLSLLSAGPVGWAMPEGPPVPHQHRHRQGTGGRKPGTLLLLRLRQEAEVDSAKQWALRWVPGGQDGGLGAGPGAPGFPEDEAGTQAQVHFAEEKLEARREGEGREGAGQALERSVCNPSSDQSGAGRRVFGNEGTPCAKVWM